ncbi:VUT family protein [Fluoribacter dumoffii]|uniref:Uncharacterized ACR, YhhQ family COG1738 n=1 Tax=Fluoribacter dumoffii TaxID=463 RepID=A0A377G608_9GAMM|nr:VUT family protein [Fluoribacter dumoffii]KTC91613.1 hypothetical protein Ldum_2681 [Fluoribacter dumoffii NY 23]MCW8387263.1 VUT family protein [Fluoribacter dumoffii]MCW8497467.1 VUT family protein [Fluoribacter dumoffii]STO20079.1 Uncharacterized ACR, YhhQ family COG1738 [Fluoribacter dumoffii]
MNQSLPSQRSRCFLFLTLSVITSLILLINVSFKIIAIQGLMFSVIGLICPLVTGLYLLALRNCTIKEQRHLLNISLITLYVFCIGVYVLINLPPAEYMHNNSVYQIIFEDLPKKFFATTIAFALSFYLPHLFAYSKSSKGLPTPKQCMLLALLGGIFFFGLDFFLLFSGTHLQNFKQIYLDSFLIASLILLLIGIFYLTVLLKYENLIFPARGSEELPLYHYFICVAIVVMLICLACEYRIVTLVNKYMVLSASSLFFPITLVISTILGELWGYRVNLKLCLILIATQFTFDVLLMGIVALPSPPFFNLNPFYNYIMPTRLPAASLTLFIAFISNAMLLHYLKHSKWNLHRPLRILIANFCSNFLLCLIDYCLLFGGIYPYEQIINLIVNVWLYKSIMTLISLPLILWFCAYLEKKKSLILQYD